MTPSPPVIPQPHTPVFLPRGQDSSHPRTMANMTSNLDAHDPLPESPLTLRGSAEMPPPMDMRFLVPPGRLH